MAKRTLILERVKPIMVLTNPLTPSSGPHQDLLVFGSSALNQLLYITDQEPFWIDAVKSGCNYCLALLNRLQPRNISHLAIASSGPFYLAIGTRVGQLSSNSGVTIVY